MTPVAQAVTSAILVLMTIKILICILTSRPPFCTSQSDSRADTHREAPLQRSVIQTYGRRSGNVWTPCSPSLHF